MFKHQPERKSVKNASKLILSFLVLSGLFLISTVSAYAVETEAESMLESLIKKAVNNSPQLISAAQEAARYKTRIALVENLTDPILAFYYLDFPLANMSKGWSARENEEKNAPSVTVRAKSSRGSIYTGRDMVEDQALWYQYVHEDLILTVTSQVRQKFYQLYFLDKIIDLNQQNLTTLDNLVETISASYAVGKVRQKDVLRAQIERYQLQAELIRLRQTRLSTASRLSYLTGQSSGGTLVPTLPEELSNDNLPTTVYSVRNLVSGLYTHKPLIKGYQALGGRFKAMRGMVRMYFNRELQDEATFEADSGFRAIAAKGEDYHLELVSDLYITQGNLEKNRELSRLYGRVIIPQGRQSFEASLADFRVGRAEFPVVLNSLIDLNRDQNLYYQALSDYMVDFARLEELSGVKLH